MTNHQLYNNGLIWYDDTKQDRNLVMGRCEARAEGSRLTTILLARALHHTQAINLPGSLRAGYWPVDQFWQPFPAIQASDETGPKTIMKIIL
jgi:hypothetical protein